MMISSNGFEKLSADVARYLMDDLVRPVVQFKAKEEVRKPETVLLKYKMKGEPIPEEVLREFGLSNKKKDGWHLF